jgi:hypothetical protein
MQQKAFNPLFLSALDILTGALGVFIVLNFLNTHQPANPAQKELLAHKAETAKTEPTPKNTPLATQNTGSGQYKSNPVNPPARPSSASVPPQPPAPTPPVVVVKPSPPVPPEDRTPTPPQDPVAVDLMKQTQGAVVLLLQQPDRAKNGVEFMLRQGNRTWKPTRASKYQDNDFQYQKSLNYFFQSEINPGMYEVLVRVKRGQRGEGPQNIAFFGKIAPPGQPVKTYNFGAFSVNGAQSDWISAGGLTVSTAGLQFHARLPAANAQPASSSQPASTPVAKQETKTKPEKGRSGKWGNG